MKLLFKIIRKIFNYFKRKSKRELKQLAKRALVAYLVASLPVGYIVTAVTSKTAELNQPIQVAKEWLSGGLANVITLGLAKPLEETSEQAKRAFDGVKYEAQKFLSEFGEKTGAWTIEKPKEVVYVAPSQYLDEAMSWSFVEYPDYYRVIGKSEIDPSTFPVNGQISYGGLDNLGRTTTVSATLTFTNVQSSYGKREQFSSTDNPSGWIGNATDEKGKIIPFSIKWLNGKVYNGAFFNKSHLVADSLGGKATRENAITAPRTQNVGGTDQKGGMRYPEIKAKDWLEQNQSGVLYYRPEPIYNGNELVPRGVVVSLLSSDGSIDEKVLVYNTANGYTINYNTGQFAKNK